MAAAFFVLSAVGMFMAAYGQLEASRQNASLLEEKADFLSLQADEILERNEINNKLIKRHARQLKSEQFTTGISRGLGEVSRLEMLEETAQLAGEQIGRNTREARFEAFSLEKEAISLERGAREVRKAGILGVTTTLLGGGANLARSTPGTDTKIPSLGAN